jgi:hypothetical protein
VVLSPYGTGLVVAWSRLANRLVTRFVYVFTAIGWAALATLFVGVFAVGDHTGMAMAMASAPFAGLAVWTPGPGRDDGDPPAPDPEDVPPTPDAVKEPGRRLPAPARRRPTGHPAPSRPRVPAR